MAYSKRFGEDVARAIGDRKQRDIAEQMNASQTIVTHMVNGRIVSDEYIRKFAHAIGEDSAGWLRRAKMYREEAHLRDLGYLSDEAVKDILGIMEREEEEHRQG